MYLFNRSIKANTIDGKIETVSTESSNTKFVTRISYGNACETLKQMNVTIAF